MSHESKAYYVASQGQTRDHTCHWPGCTQQVPPAKWGCKAHWFKLPRSLRNKIWQTYQPGQEVRMDPSKAYLAAAQEVQDWIRKTSRPEKAPVTKPAVVENQQSIGFDV